MELRDKLNTAEGYSEIIDKYCDYIKNKLSKIEILKEDEVKGIQNYPRKNIDIIQSKYSTILNYQLNVIVAKYSLGEDINQIKSMIPDCIFYLEKSWEAESGYVQMSEMLSIGIMLEIDDKEFEKLVRLVERDQVKDYLIDYLIKYRKPDWHLTTTFLWKKPYRAIAEIVELSKENEEKIVHRLKKYLTNQWYKAWGAKDTHTSKWNIHTGYWSFESGALAKILQLDDSTLKDHKYYPYDMVHYKMDDRV